MYTPTLRLLPYTIALALLTQSCSAIDELPSSQTDSTPASETLPNVDATSWAYRQKTVMRILDVNTDGELSAQEVENATEQLLKLDTNKDQQIELIEMGGPGPTKGMIRTQSLIRVLDKNGDLSLSADEIKLAPKSIIRLDHDHDWKISQADLAFPSNTGGGEASMQLSRTDIMRLLTYSDSITGDILPGANNQQAPGYLFMYEASNNNDVHQTNRAYLLNEQGTVVHEWKNQHHSPEGVNAYLLENGYLLRTVSKHDWIHHKNYPVGAHGIIEIMDWDSNVLWQYELDVPNKEALHHDHQYLANGNIIVTVYVAFSREEMQLMGWDLSLSDKQTIWLEKLIELKPNLEDGSTEIVWEWKSWDHFIQDEYPDKANFGVIEQHKERIDLNYPVLSEVPFNSGQLIHLNSVNYNEELDQIMMSSATYGEVWIIDHSTTVTESASSKGGQYSKGGDLLYRFGNPLVTDKNAEDDTVLFFQHDAHWIDKGLPGEGNVLIYNNGSRRNMDGSWNYQQKGVGFGEAYTDILEFSLPLNEHGNYDIQSEPTIKWSWNSDGKQQFYSPFMSGAQRMENGNTLLVSGYSKRIIEVTKSGERVMDFRLPGPGRAFRVYKYPKDYPAFKTKKLVELD